MGRGDAAHLVRVAALAVAGVVIFVLVRAALVPADFGAYGHYRGGAIEDNRKDPIVHAGRAVCAECHTDQAAAALAGAHRGLSCEGCHGPQAAHAGAPDQHTPVRPDARPLCVNCHSLNVARPAAFPQVDPAEHAGESTCTDCHAAHTPGN